MTTNNIQQKNCPFNKKMMLVSYFALAVSSIQMPFQTFVFITESLWVKQVLQ